MWDSVLETIHSWVLAIMQNRPDISVGNQMERFGSTGNFPEKKDHTNLVPRVLRLFGQRVGARKDSREFEKKFKNFDWLLRNSLHCFTAEILR